MSNIEQMTDNLSYMENFKPLDEKEKAVVENARLALEAIPRVPCTSCGYCLKGCPKGIHIPQIFDAVNKYMVYDDLGAAKFGYMLEQKFGSAKASDCIECRACEEVCPQKIPIIDELKKAVKLLAD